MFTIFQKKKIEEAVEQKGATINPETGEIDVYVVSWWGRKGEFSSDKRRVAKSFISPDAAKAFKKELEAAQALLKNTEDLDIRIDKQE